MAYSQLPAKAAGDTLDLANYDNIDDNFQAGVPDIFTTKGDLAAATGANAATRLGVGADDSILVADAGESEGIAWQIMPSARVYDSDGENIGAGAWKSIEFDSEDWDSDSCHSAGSNPSRLTVPVGGAGIYTIGANVKWDDTAAGQRTRGMRFRLNGATVIGEEYDYPNVSVKTVWLRSVVYDLADSDYVEVQVYCSNGDDMEVVADYAPSFWFQWLRRRP